MEGSTDVTALRILDRDLQNLGLSDHVTSPEAIETALKVKRYLTDQIDPRIMMRIPRDEERKYNPEEINLSPLRSGSLYLMIEKPSYVEGEEYISLEDAIQRKKKTISLIYHGINLPRR